MASAILVGGLLFSAPAESANPPVFWTKLLRYDGGTSQVINSDFFLTENGRENELAEWEAMVSMVQKVGRRRPGDDHPVCRFPARTWVVSHFGKVPMPDLSGCQKLNRFLGKIDTKAVSLVFASYYMGSPSSSFGHTFFRLHNRRSGESGNDLLDYGVNYAALVDTGNPLVYGFKGIFGGFDGRFSLTPFFLKKLEYNDLESRDIWDYELALNHHQLKLFTLHLWEMDGAVFEYSYFRQNCSYHILAFLDAILPGLGMLGDLGTIIIPYETILPLLEKEGLVRQIRHRPSLHKQFSQKVNQLTDEELNVLDEVLEDDRTWNLDFLSPSSQARIIETSIAHGDMNHRKELLLHPKMDTPWKRKRGKLLSVRSKIHGVSDVFVPYNKVEAGPHLSHRSGRFTLGAQKFHQARLRSILGYRFALHDVIDPPAGFSPFSQLIMGDFRLRHDEATRSIKFDRFHLINIAHAPSWRSYLKPLSWRFVFGAERAETLRKEGNTVFTTVALGGSFTMFEIFNLNMGAVADFRHFLDLPEQSNWKENQPFIGGEARLTLLLRDDLRATFHYQKLFGPGESHWNEWIESRFRWDANRFMGVELFSRGGSRESSSGGRLHFFF